MINEEKIDKLYDEVIKGEELTTKRLKEIGIDAKNIKELMELGLIERIKRGHYVFLDSDKLFSYGKKLISLKRYDDAYSCFLKCHELDPENEGVCFRLFLRSIQDKDYSKTFEYFGVLNSSENIFYIKDNDFYLYLLSMITELPDNYKEYIKAIQLDDIKVRDDDKRFKNSDLQNKMRIAAFNQKFVLAARILKESTHETKRMTVQDVLIKSLLNEVIEVQTKNRNKMLELLNDKRYSELMFFLKDINSHHNLSLSENYILFLTEKILDIKETGIIPEKTIFNTNNLFNAIEGNNFELALTLCIERNKRENIAPESNLIYLLLRDINVEIKKLEKVNNEILLVTNEELEPEPKEIKDVDIKREISKTFFLDFITLLMRNDLDNAFKILKDYLNSIRKIQYEFLIINLIKLSIIENDMAFTKPMIVITNISKDDFELNISEYIKAFYEMINSNKLNEARIYLDILKTFDIDIMVIEGLESIFQKKEDINKKENAEIEGQITFEEIPNNIKEENGNKKESSQKKSKIIEHDSEFDFIMQKRELAKENGIVVLKPMDTERRRSIHKVVERIPDLFSFSIGDKNERRIVLRYKPYKKEFVDIKNLFRIGNKAYYSNDYDSCIEAYRQILEFNIPKARVYSMLGMAYLKKNMKDIAISYLEVATELSKQEGTNLDYTDLIARVKGIIPEEDRKPRFKMSEEDFKDDIHNYYGIESIKEIFELIQIGMSIEDASDAIGLNEEQKQIVLLIFAREYYSNENYNLGDICLKKVERAKNKSKFVISLFEEIRKNKKFYKNRISREYSLLLVKKSEK